MAAKSGKTSKKIKRGGGQNMAYKAEHRHEKGHMKRLLAHVKRYGLAPDAEAALMKYAGSISLNTVQSTMAFLKQVKEAARAQG